MWIKWVHRRRRNDLSLQIKEDVAEAGAWTLGRWEWQGHPGREDHVSKCLWVWAENGDLKGQDTRPASSDGKGESEESPFREQPTEGRSEKGVLGSWKDTGWAAGPSIGERGCPEDKLQGPQVLDPHRELALPPFRVSEPSSLTRSNYPGPAYILELETETESSVKSLASTGDHRRVW